MAQLNSHWTENSIEDFLYRIAFDYITQLEQAMEAEGTSQSKLAAQLRVSEGRVSQVFNNPGNFTLRKMIEYARALKKKVAIVAYDDDDPTNQNGPINSGVFLKCWELVGKPSNFFAFTQYRVDETVTSGGDATLLSPAGPNQYICGSHSANLFFKPVSEVGGPYTAATECFDQRDLLWQSPSR